MSENGPTGYDASAWVCDGGNQQGSSITLALADDVTCTITNTKRGHIIVDKVTIGGDATFGFDASGGTAPAYQDFAISGADTPNDQELRPGSYSVVENIIPINWDQTSATCDNGDDPSAITLGAGDVVTCTFVNTKRGIIIVDKVTQPAGHSQVFSFDASGGSYIDFNLTDAQNPNSQVLVPGAYSVSETIPANWDLLSATCVSSIQDSETPGSLELDAGETITCTFTNQKDSYIIVDKVTDPSGDTQSFTFNTTGAGYTGFSLTDVDEPNNSGDLAPGVYSVAEVVPAGWDLTSVYCGGAIDGPVPSAWYTTYTPGDPLQLDAGETITCTFNNQKDANIIVQKVTIGGDDSFEFDTDYA
ncbi:MAG TPA: hypothetical protein DIS54_00085, partial [Candidatus Veblenbacteria bacterium]|nr:hypothetical protein [Candidatus Veblenbacteria bacterium]